MSTQLEKTDKPGLYRDTQTGAVLNTDLTSLQAYKRKKQKQLEFQERQERIEQEIDEIKSLLREALGKLNDK